MQNNYKLCKRETIFLSLISIFLIGGIFTYEAKIRPVKITVIDADTKEPIKEIKVYYMLESHYIRDKLLFVIPNPDPQAIRTTRILEERYTDEKGEVLFEGRSLVLDKRESYLQEEIFINLELNSDDLEIAKLAKLHKIEYLRHKSFSGHPDNYNKEYWGANIYSTSYPAYQVNEVKHKTFTIIWNSNGLNKKSEEFIIELEKYDN